MCIAQHHAPLEEIAATARQLPENIQRAPISGQALSGDFLDRNRVTRLYDLQFDVPGLVINNRGMLDIVGRRSCPIACSS